jgi:hypothetical protein
MLDIFGIVRISPYQPPDLSLGQVGNELKCTETVSWSFKISSNTTSGGGCYEWLA